MNWKILSYAILIGLTITVLAYDVNLYSVPSILYMSASKFALPIPSGLSYTTLENVSSSERVQIISYLEASDTLHGNYIQVSGELSPISAWAESMYNTHLTYTHIGGQTYHDARFNLKLNEDDYYQVLLWQKKAYNPSSLEYSVNVILNLLTVSLWIVLVHKTLKEPNKT